ncbi:hypothetical protein G6F56_014584 [Rhizopus delemar]|nr:hypothetical protein G6F56_014584 [Rhizopus delemar]
MAVRQAGHQRHAGGVDLHAGYAAGIQAGAVVPPRQLVDRALAQAEFGDVFGRQACKAAAWIIGRGEERDEGVG